MRHIIIGTAGHVDHGKSALIKALTGVDTDRLKEEKARGISIDLGFAALELEDGLQAGVVDVPGHERFLKNMLAGTGGIDMALLVIAADEGVMPQTSEHLAMLNLYGIKHGLVAVNKIDKVDSEWLELVEDDIRKVLQGTFLSDVPLCRVSAVTGEGLSELRQKLVTTAKSLPGRDSKSPFRLWIDRAFTVKGHGVVVTGSVLSGSAKVGDTLTLFPAGQDIRIRGLQSHNSKADCIEAGQRAAINIAGVELGELARGMALAAGERGQVDSQWDVRMDWHEEATSGTRVRLHLGTGEYLGRIYSFKNAETRYMRLLLEEPLYGACGDRGIVRLYSPQRLIGGVTLISPGNKSRRLTEKRTALANSIYNGQWEDAIFQAINESKQPVTRERLLGLAGFIRDEKLNYIIQTLLDDGKIASIGGQFLSAEQLSALSNNAVNVLSGYHAAQSDKPGFARESVRQKLGLDPKTFDILVKHWHQDGLLAGDGAELALTTHAEKHGNWKHDLAHKAAQAFADIGLTHITDELLAERMGIAPGKAKAAAESLTLQGVLIKVGDLRLFHKTVTEIILQLKRHFESKPTITVGEFRDMLNTSRKVALPLLEYMDVNKYTMRDNDVRRPYRRLSNFSE